MEKKRLHKVLYVAMRYDYGKQEQGTSFEFNNFYKTLERMIPIVVEFDFMDLIQQHGKERMNAMLLETARREQPDLIFCILFTDEVLKDTLQSLTDQFPTFNWFCDDHWRFDNFSKRFAPYFSFISTTDHDAAAKYTKIGYKNALLTQWACNHHDYVKMDNIKKTLDVTFVGQPHGNRKRLVASLQRHSLRVEAYGRGWNNGRISQEQMIRMFNASKVNLNLSNSSWNIHTFFRRQEQIKGRNFEIPGCGGFLLTNYVAGLEHYYDLDTEVVCFKGKRELIDKIRYYLGHEEETERIARKGYQRTLSEHTYEKRFTRLFEQMGFTP